MMTNIIIDRRNKEDWPRIIISQITRSLRVDIMKPCQTDQPQTTAIFLHVIRKTTDYAIIVENQTILQENDMLIKKHGILLVQFPSNPTFVDRFKSQTKLESDAPEVQPKPQVLNKLTSSRCI